MDIRQIANDYAVSGQIGPEDVADIAAAGFKTIICHRPDGEAEDQPSHAAIEKAARQAGLEFCYIPFVGSQMTVDKVAAMADALAEAEGPVFGYCRSGARSTNIYMAVQQARG